MEQQTNNIRKYTKEEIEKAVSLDIVDYCMQNDIPIKSDSERYYRLADHDSLIIDRKKNQFYWNSRGVNGNIINFVQEVEGASFPGAMQRLLDGEKDYEKSSDVTFVSEPYDYEQFAHKEVDRFDRAKEYLVNDRKIDSQVVDALHNKGLIKQDKYNNVLFLWKDRETGEVMGGSEQGVVKSDKYKRGAWKNIQKNSTANYGFNVLNGEPRNLKFFESSIDLLSYASLHKQDLQDTHLVSMEGLKPQVVFNYYMKSLERIGDVPDSLSLCVDNDRAGKAFAERLIHFRYEKNDGSIVAFKPEYPKAPEGEQKWDWNDECKRVAKQQEQVQSRKSAYLQQMGRER
ncbi:DUF3991 and TOPRIM domain-containing protein [Bacillus toyonensis]|uniref:DUF3991 and TOPRIM domain-containing protein n=1 Tax=Bacillus toyonensis TaxID=155322 RepID=UPI0021D1420E|nr:DUF3991 and TOPRIM domain-containing protein [Bacillus toyonensis]MCU4771054.1 DUF3991 and toprim domain-containing protein [Bacillus toyonensis]